MFVVFFPSAGLAKNFIFEEKTLTKKEEGLGKYRLSAKIVPRQPLFRLEKFSPLTWSNEAQSSSPNWTTKNGSYNWMPGDHETSINKVLKYSGISRGALTHHYGTKESMIVETLERILDPVRGTRTLGKPPINKIDERNTENFRNNLVRLWVNVVNTPEGRALVEILIIARTDNALFEK